MSQYHDILEISPNATLEEVKTAYRKKALQFHPDKASGPDTAKKFMEINNANNTHI